MSAGEVCPESQLLDSKEYCKAAGLILGYAIFETTNRLQRPYGCFWDDNNPGKAIFNLADTVNKNWDSVAEGSICGWKQGIWNSIKHRKLKKILLGSSLKQLK